MGKRNARTADVNLPRHPIRQEPVAITWVDLPTVRRVGNPGKRVSRQGRQRYARISASGLILAVQTRNPEVRSLHKIRLHIIIAKLSVPLFRILKSLAFTASLFST